MEELMQKLTAVIRAVSNVNVFFITDGEAVLQGTPVDDAVNGAFAQRARERKAARKPFVTTLVAQAGKIVRGTVTLPGETIPLPPRPEPQKRAEKTVTPAATNALTTRGAATGPILTLPRPRRMGRLPAQANKPPSGVIAGTDAPSNATPAAPAVIPPEAAAKSR
jgi:hypothetical protein